MAYCTDGLPVESAPPASTHCVQLSRAVRTYGKQYDVQKPAHSGIGATWTCSRTLRSSRQCDETPETGRVGFTRHRTPCPAVGGETALEALEMGNDGLPGKPDSGLGRPAGGSSTIRAVHGAPLLARESSQAGCRLFAPVVGTIPQYSVLYKYHSTVQIPEVLNNQPQLGAATPYNVRVVKPH